LTKEHSFLRVGVTGGIGSGKSTVCTLFTKLGRTVLSADDIARDLTETNSDIKASIRETFGDDVFLPNGALHRRALAEIIFKDAGAKEQLNAIVHPLVFEVLEEKIHKLKPADRHPYIIIEAALIYETRMDDDLEYVIVVNAKDETRIQRVMQRDKLTREGVLSRMQAQMDVKEKVELADFVIENEGSEAELIERISFVDKLLAMLAHKPA
jgi:dephospho-CoA kinase